MDEISFRAHECARAAAEDAQEVRLRRFALTLIGTFFGALGALLLAILYIDPYDSGRFPSLGVQGTSLFFQRYANVGLARSARFDSAIFGNSHAQLIDPQRLSAATGMKFVQLATPGANPPELLVTMRWFIRHHTEISALVLGFDERWCTTDRVIATRTPFPFWLYGDSNLVYIANMLSTRTLRDSVDRVMFALGRRPVPRQDGYDDYEIGRTRNFHPAQTFPPRREQPGPALAELAATAPARSFPAIDMLDDVLRDLPEVAKVVVVLPPQYASRVADDDGSLEQGINACKLELWRRTRPRGAFLDFLVQSPITRDADNFWDEEHYTSKVARTVEARLAEVLDAASR